MTQLLPVSGRNAEGLAKVGTLGLLFAEWGELHPVEKGAERIQGRGQKMQKHRRLCTDYIQNKFCLYRM